MKNFLAAFRMLAVALAACLPLSAPAQTANAKTSALTLDAAAMRQAGIVLDKAVQRPLSDEIKAPGEVKADAYASVLVAPRVDSQVLARKVRLGAMVRAGQPLVTLSSVEVAETQGTLIVAEQDWQRIAALGAQAVSARRYSEAKVQRDQARAKLRAYGLSDSQISALLRAGSARADGSYDLLAPSDGRVATDDFLAGERVGPGRTLFTLVKEDTVWIEAQLPPADAERVTAGGVARVLAHGVELPGVVVQRSHLTDERTRTAPVRIEVKNRDDLLHPGELVEARLVTASTAQVLAVPTEAVVLLQNQPTVFVATGTDRFEPAPVRTGATRDGWVEIQEGLDPGVSYVRRGAFALKARLLRSQLGDE